MAAFSKSSFSKTWTFFQGDWHEGNVPIMGPRTHAAWLGSRVFDGARAFEGVTLLFSLQPFKQMLLT